MVNQELVDYIKEKISSGGSLSDAKDELKNKGWAGADIEEAANEYFKQEKLSEDTGEDKIKIRDKPLTKGKMSLSKKIQLIVTLIIVLFGIIPGAIILKGKIEGIINIKEANQHEANAVYHSIVAWEKFKLGKTKYIEGNYSEAIKYYSEAKEQFSNSSYEYRKAFEVWEKQIESKVISKPKIKRLNIYSANLSNVGIKKQDAMVRASENMIEAIDYFNKKDYDKGNKFVIEANREINSSREWSTIYDEYRTKILAEMGKGVS